MKHVIGILLVVLLSGGACASHVPPNLTPAASAAYTADQIVKRIGEAQQAVIDASDANKINVADARTIVLWTRTTLKALGEAPNGWQAVALAGWPDVRALLLANATLSPWVPTLDDLLRAR